VEESARLLCARKRGPRGRVERVRTGAPGCARAFPPSPPILPLFPPPRRCHRWGKELPSNSHLPLACLTRLLSCVAARVIPRACPTRGRQREKERKRVSSLRPARHGHHHHLLLLSHHSCPTGAQFPSWAPPGLPRPRPAPARPLPPRPLPPPPPPAPSSTQAAAQASPQPPPPHQSRTTFTAAAWTRRRLGR